jgi:hypothetical protein
VEPALSPGRGAATGQRFRLSLETTRARTMPLYGATDPLDAGQPYRKAWEEFRAGFSAALLQVWLLNEIKKLAPRYFEDLEFRFFAGFEHAKSLAADDPDYDGAIPLQGPMESGSVWFIDREEAEELYEQLFPHNTPAIEDQTAALGLAVVGLHSAFEAYAKAVGAHTKGPLPPALASYFRARKEPFDSWLADKLTECDATRHIVVHNRGVVDQAYVNTVKDNRLHPGERRPLNFEVVSQFATALWRTAVLLRRQVPPS